MASGPKGISQFASTFIIASNRCAEPRPLPNGQIEMPLIPGLICLAFSIELNFKAIILQSGGKTTGHKLELLFNKIEEIHRNRIINESGYSSDIFMQKLTAASDTFIQWRYVFESNGLNTDYQFLSALASASQRISSTYCKD